MCSLSTIFLSPPSNLGSEMLSTMPSDRISANGFTGKWPLPILPSLLACCISLCRPRALLKHSRVSRFSLMKHASLREWKCCLNSCPDACCLANSRERKTDARQEQRGRSGRRSCVECVPGFSNGLLEDKTASRTRREGTAECFLNPSRRLRLLLMRFRYHFGSVNFALGLRHRENKSCARGVRTETQPNHSDHP